MATLTGRRGQAHRAGHPARRTRPPAYERIRQRGVPYFLLIPAIVFELLIHIVPMLVGIGISFLKLTQFFLRNWSAAPFAGLSNYTVSVRVNEAIGKALLQSFGITVAYTVLSVGFAWLIGCVAAILLQGKVAGRGTLRALFLVPYALPIYAAVITWSFMLQRDTGMVNHVLVDQLHLFGSSRPFWLIGNDAFASMLVVEVWRFWPFAFLMLMAGMQNIPADAYEAAAIDGAGVFQQIRRITLPMLRPINLVLILVLFLWVFNDFNTPFILFGGSPPQAADVVSIHIYNDSFQNWNFGQGSAMSVLLLIFLLIVTMIYLGFTRRERHVV